MRSYFAAALLAVSCTPPSPPVSTVRADCSEVPPVWALSTQRLVVREGTSTLIVDPIPSDGASLYQKLKQMAFTGDLRPACAEKQTTLVPDDETPLPLVLATMSIATDNCGDTVRMPLSETQSDVPVRGLQFCHVPIEERDDELRCSHARVQVSPDRIELTRYPWGYPLPEPFGGRFGSSEVREERPSEVVHSFEGPSRAADLVGALRAPHAELPHCDAASFKVDPNLRWGELAPILSTFHEGVGLQIIVD